jgi:peptide/nickel transport system substrate-binding protein
MKAVLRFLPIMALIALLGVAIFPVAGQELLSLTAECGAENNTSNFAAIEAVDAMTVKFTLCNPDPAFLSKIAFSSLIIQSSDYLEQTGGSGDLIQNAIGTGPYKLERWDLGNELVLTRNEEYWGEPAKEPTVIFRWNAEATQRLTELQSGNVDGIDNPGEADFEVIESNPDLALFPRSGTNVFYLGLNNTIAPFDNVLVRQAIAYAIDKQRIVDNFYPPGSSVATQFMPPSLFGFTPEVEPFPYDPEKAIALLDEAGLVPNADGVRAELPLNYRDVVRGYLPSPGVVAADLQTQLAEVGIKLNIEVMESGAFLDAAAAGQLPIFLLGWGADYPDPTNFLDTHFGVGANDSMGAKHPEITEKLTEAGQVADADTRYQLYVEANTAIRDLVPMIPIAHGGNAAAFASRIVGAYSSDVGAEQFALMEDPDDDNIVWMQNGEPISLFCGDETDGETLRACEQIGQSLMAYEPGTGTVIPSLATEYTVNDTLTEWTFTLREGVTFHDGSTLDSNDVALTYISQWDAAHPLHVGREGLFTYFSSYFGGFLNPPPPTE